MSIIYCITATYPLSFCGQKGSIAGSGSGPLKAASHLRGSAVGAEALLLGRCLHSHWQEAPQLHGSSMWLL